MSRKKWTVSSCDKDIAASIAENCGIEPIIAYILCSRGYSDEFAIDSFLYDADILNPYILPDMDRAVEAIKQALSSGKRITVFGDYDTDGVTATALMYLYLKSKNANVDYYIPDRALEGYGLSCKAITLLKKKGTQFIITVDNGVSSVSEASYAKNLGVEMVITDHHQPGEILPDALAVVDPHREDYEGDFKEWAGVGIVFKLVSALEECDSEKILSDYADLIALGTIADVVPLRGENRVIVRRGIELINKGKRLGIAALKTAAGMHSDKVTSTSLAFTLTPRLNAAGRMGSASGAIELLITTSEEKAKSLTCQICEANELRKKEENDIEAAALKQIAENPLIGYERVIVVDGEMWHQGVIGIVASRLCVNLGKPVIVISRDGETAKGSGRSIPGFSLYDALSQVQDILDKFGGHTLAAGMSLQSQNIPLFRKKINEYASNTQPCFPTLNIECKLNPKSLKLELLYALKALEPCGAENSSPLFGLFNMQIVSIKAVGNGKHLKVNLKRGNIYVVAMYFGMTEDQMIYEQGDFVDLAVRFDTNEYLGEEKLSIHIRDIRFAGANDDEVICCTNLYEKFKRGERLSFEETKKLCPSRELQENLYRYIRSKGECFTDAELLCKRLNLEESSIAAINVTLDVFFELSLIEYIQEGKRVQPVNGVRANLNNSSILSSLNAKGA